MPLTYGRYLRLDRLLAAQEPLSAGPEHDELLFIEVHQVYELWFKQVLHETARLRPSLVDGDTHRTLGALKRILTIFKTLVAQVDILETMTPSAFNSFRSPPRGGERVRVGAVSPHRVRLRVQTILGVASLSGRIRRAGRARASSRRAHRVGCLLALSRAPGVCRSRRSARSRRSEEHTSELQSRPHLVCRLLLEKKKHINTSSPPKYKNHKPTRK